MKYLDRTKLIRLGCMILAGVWLVSCNNDNSPTSSSDGNSPYQATVRAILAIDDIDLVNGSGGIGPSDQVDLANMNQWLADVSQNTGFPTDLTVLKASDGNLTQAALAAAIAGMKAKITKNDVLVFWYSGHGAANENSGATKWPIMAFQDPAGRYNYIEVDFNAAVIAPLKASGAKLVIAAADCCNNFLSQAKSRGFARATSDNYLTLFKQQGTLIMSGAIRGEVSYGNTYTGGQFTAQFLQSFYDNVASANPSWRTILSNATRAIVDPADGSVQHPQGELNI